MLVINKLDDGRPGVAVVDVVTESGSINDRQLDLELLFLELGLDDFNLCQFVELLVVTPVIVFRRRKFGGKKRVDESGFSETRLACTGLK
jgi:hypothetical protein